MAEYTLAPTQSESLETVTGRDPAEPVADGGDRCGAELDRGGKCERPADECPYHD